MSNADPRAATPPGVAWCWGLRLLAAAGCGVSGYLFKVSLSGWDLPAGCGAGTGCADVLTSRWATVFGVPVSAPALGVYLSVLGASCCVGRSWSAPARAMAWMLLVALATVLLGAAAWFLALQDLAVQALCRWCIADHALGVTIAGMILWQAWGTAAGAERPLFGRRHLAAAMGAGLAAVLVLIAAQWTGLGNPPVVARRLPLGGDAETGPGPNRRIVLLNTTLPLAAHQVPIIGSPDAPRLLVLLFDYCCAECRAMHRDLIHVVRRYDGQVSLILLPMPLDADCNPAVDQTDDAFRDACELARLALAVWRTAPAAFPQFDALLCQGDRPPAADEARQIARQLIAPARLEAALADPWIGERIATDVGAFAESRADRIPLLLSPGIAPIVGHPGRREQLVEILERELNLHHP